MPRECISHQVCYRSEAEFQRLKEKLEKAKDALAKIKNTCEFWMLWRNLAQEEDLAIVAEVTSKSLSEHLEYSSAALKELEE